MNVWLLVSISLISVSQITVSQTISGEERGFSSFCPEHLEFLQCGPICPPTCEKQEGRCPSVCVPGCFCPNGTVMHENSCIKEDECPEAQNPIECPPNEQYIECGSACGGTCEPVVDLLCPTVCVEGCFCMPGMVRHEGNCIPFQNCPPPNMTEECDGLMEYTDCGSACPPTCDEEPSLCPLICVPGCFCPSGTVLHEGNCITRDQCPQECDGLMEYSDCGSACPPTCVEEERQCPLICVEGCFCPSGTVLHEGVCIPRDLCPRDCPGDMVFQECGSACPITCDDRDPVCTLQCVQGCFCPPGTVLHDGECIEPEECPPQECPFPLVFNQCGSACPPSCDKQNRTCTTVCVPGCFCPPGTISNGDDCIPPDLCPQDCPDDMEFRQCGSACPETCDSDPNQLCTLECVPGCFCPPGTLLHNGECITRDQCPEECTPPFVFTSCGSACVQTCDTLGNIACPTVCVPGCFCPPGTIFNDGNCIPPDQCPIECPGDMEFQQCGSGCPETCDSDPDQICTFECVPGCFCPPGTVLHDGECILRDQCPQDCPAGMEFQSCGTACPPTCDEPNPTECTEQCVRGCFCPSGTVLHEGECITVDRCPEEECPDGMVFNGCGSACPATCDPPTDVCTLQCVSGCFCPPGTVLHEGNCINPFECPLDCPAGMEFQSCGTACPPTCDEPNPTECTEQCVRGCFCPSGTVLHEGECITVDRCPEEECPEGMLFNGCGSACPATCDPPPEVCTLQCVRGCFCPPGTVLHEGNCIDEQECPLDCPAGMEFQSCGTACPPTCDEPNPTECTEQCVRGCFCPSGTVLHEGECITVDRCLEEECPPGMEFNACGSACPATCDQPDIPCTQECVRGCFCPLGMVLYDGGCVALEDCPEVTTPRPRPECRLACRNGGTCVAGPELAYCECPSGYTGRFCENTLTTPRPQPECRLACQNGATCVAEPEPAFCRCPGGYTGRFCESAITTPRPRQECRLACQNGGTCVWGHRHAYCRCMRGYSGRLCENSVTTPRPRPKCPLVCQNGGNCIAAFGKAFCACRQGYSGRLCENAITTARPTPECRLGCRNGGICASQNGRTYCKCRSGYSGWYCQTKNTTPRPRPECRLGCQNGGTCVAGPERAYCRCTSGYTGRLCENRPCSCRNGGRCYTYNRQTRCHCLPRYYGTSCEKRRSISIRFPCFLTRCSHSGRRRCYSHGFTNYSCECKSNFAGERCQYQRISGGTW